MMKNLTRRGIKSSITYCLDPNQSWSSPPKRLSRIDERCLGSIFSGVQDAYERRRHAELFFGETHQSEEYRAREDLGEVLGEVALPRLDESVNQGNDPPRASSSCSSMRFGAKSGSRSLRYFECSGGSTFSGISGS